MGRGGGPNSVGLHNLTSKARIGGAKHLIKSSNYISELIFMLSRSKLEPRRLFRCIGGPVHS